MDAGEEFADKTMTESILNGKQIFKIAKDGRDAKQRNTKRCLSLQKNMVFIKRFTNRLIAAMSVSLSLRFRVVRAH